MQHLVILDYSSATVEFFKIANCTEDTIEDIIESLGFNLDEISYMWGDEDLKLIFHNESN